MRVVETAKLIVGSCLVFLAVASLNGACGSNATTAQGQGGSARTGAGGAGNGGTSNGAGGHGAGIVSDAFADADGSRLKPNVLNGADGSKHSLGTFRDTQRNEDCSFTNAVDGKWRCIPTYGEVVTDEFADANCTELLGFTTERCGIQKPLYLLKSRDNGSCGATLYKPGAEITTTYFKSGNTCTNAGALGPSTHAFRLGEVVDLSGFVSASQATD